MRASVCLVVLSLLLGQVRAASAQNENPGAVARALAQEGIRLFEKDDFQGALAKFTQAYAKVPNAKLFLNIGLALRGLSRNVEAFTAFERFLTEAKDAGPEFIEQATTQMAELNDKLARVAVESNRVGAVVAIDGERRGDTPLPKLLAVEPGPHRLTLTWQGETKSADFVALAGEELSQRLDFEGRQPLFAPAVAVPRGGLPYEAQQPVAETGVAHNYLWYWIAGGAVVAAVATTLIIVLARSDSYPTADLGSRIIGDVR
jgi:tetratricopeptide (TPR) repeat protein